MRRSELLESNYREFMGCMNTPECNVSIAMALKPDAVRDAWRRASYRLLVENDWAKDADPYERKIFFTKLREVGPEGLRPAHLVRHREVARDIFLYSAPRWI